MPDDINLKIGADNAPLDSKLSEAAAMVNRWKADIEAESINVKFDPEFSEELDDIKAKSGAVGDSLGSWAEKLGPVISKFSLISTAVGVVYAALKAMADTINNLALTKFNKELEKSADLIEKVDRAGKRIRDRENAKIVEAGDIDKAELNRRNAETEVRQAKANLERATEAANKPGLKDFAVTRNPLALLGLTADGKRTAAEKKVAEDELKIAEQKLLEAENAKESTRAKKETDSKKAAEEAAKAIEKQREEQEKLAKELEKEIALSKEKSLRSEGKTDEADKLRQQREFKENATKFGSIGAAAALLEQDKRAIAGEKAEDARKEKERADEKAKREAESELEKAEGALKRGSESRTTRQASFNRRFAELSKKDQTPLGGFDRGFASLGDRIATAANTQSPEVKALEKLAADQKVFTDAANKKRDEQIKAVIRAAEAVEKLNVGMR